ncbi:MAG TPA: hypothetical protein ENK11_06580 [Phycisphaerales bacterium]|nr:hypothetical protein [Phycisphaerales bacterium]
MPHENPIPCASCGYDLRGVKIGDQCPECGTVVRQYPVQDQIAGKAVASFALGILSLAMCMYYGIPSIILGWLAMRFAKAARLAVQDGAAPTLSLSLAAAGHRCGLIGLILGIVMLVLIVAYLLFLVLFIGVAAVGAAGAAGPGPVPFP